MKYSEVKQKATQHPLIIDRKCGNLILGDCHGACGVGSTYKYIYGDDIERTEEANANAVLMAHCTNKFEDLLKAFEAVMLWCDDSDDFEDESCLVKARTIIIDAREVDGI